MRIWDYEYMFVDTDTIGKFEDHKLINHLQNLRNDGYVIETSYPFREGARIVLCQRSINLMFVTWIVMVAFLVCVIGASIGIYQSLTL